MILSFPGGSGGNWLKSIFEDEPLVPGQINFHTHTAKSKITLVHSLTPSEFDYLLSGTYYFNFYLNVLYKYFYKEKHFFEQNNYKEYYTCCVNTARYLCQFDTIKDKIFFNFDDLIHNDKKFYNCLIEADPTLTLDFKKFVFKKQTFFDTFIDTTDVYENFDNQYWVTFVLGQLMNLGIYPNNFSIYSPESQSQSSEFAYNNYKFCTLNKIHQFKTKIKLPDLPVK